MEIIFTTIEGFGVTCIIYSIVLEEIYDDFQSSYFVYTGGSKYQVDKDTHDFIFDEVVNENFYQGSHTGELKVPYFLKSEHEIVIA